MTPERLAAVEEATRRVLEALDLSPPMSNADALRALETAHAKFVAWIIQGAEMSEHEQAATADDAGDRFAETVRRLLAHRPPYQRVA